MFDVTEYSSVLGIVLEKKSGKTSLTYSKYDPMTGVKLQTIKETLDMAQILARRDRLQLKLNNLNALIADLEKVKEV